MGLDSAGPADVFEVIERAVAQGLDRIDQLARTSCLLDELRRIKARGNAEELKGAIHALNPFYSCVLDRLTDRKQAPHASKILGQLLMDPIFETYELNSREAVEKLCSTLKTADEKVAILLLHSLLDANNLWQNSKLVKDMGRRVAEAVSEAAASWLSRAGGTDAKFLESEEAYLTCIKAIICIQEHVPIYSRKYSPVWAPVALTMLAHDSRQVRQEATQALCGLDINVTRSQVLKTATVTVFRGIVARLADMLQEANTRTAAIDACGWLYVLLGESVIEKVDMPRATYIKLTNNQKSKQPKDICNILVKLLHHRWKHTALMSHMLDAWAGLCFNFSSRRKLTTRKYFTKLMWPLLERIPTASKAIVLHQTFDLLTQIGDWCGNEIFSKHVFQSLGVDVMSKTLNRLQDPIKADLSSVLLARSTKFLIALLKRDFPVSETDEKLQLTHWCSRFSSTLRCESKNIFMTHKQAVELSGLLLSFIKRASQQGDQKLLNNTGPLWKWILVRVADVEKAQLLVDCLKLICPDHEIDRPYRCVAMTELLSAPKQFSTQLKQDYVKDLLGSPTISGLREVLQACTCIISDMYSHGRPVSESVRIIHRGLCELLDTLQMLLDSQPDTLVVISLSNLMTMLAPSVRNTVLACYSAEEVGSQREKEELGHILVEKWTQSCLVFLLSPLTHGRAFESFSGEYKKGWEALWAVFSNVVVTKETDSHPAILPAPQDQSRKFADCILLALADDIKDELAFVFHFLCKVLEVERDYCIKATTPFVHCVDTVELMAKRGNKRTRVSFTNTQTLSYRCVQSLAKPRNREFVPTPEACGLLRCLKNLLEAIQHPREAWSWFLCLSPGCCAYFGGNGNLRKPNAHNPGSPSGKREAKKDPHVGTGVEHTEQRKRLFRLWKTATKMLSHKVVGIHKFDKVLLREATIHPEISVGAVLLHSLSVSVKDVVRATILLWDKTFAHQIPDTKVGPPSPEVEKLLDEIMSRSSNPPPTPSPELDPSTQLLDILFRVRGEISKLKVPEASLHPRVSNFLAQAKAQSHLQAPKAFKTKTIYASTSADSSISPASTTPATAFSSINSSVPTIKTSPNPGNKAPKIPLHPTTHAKKAITFSDRRETCENALLKPRGGGESKELDDEKAKPRSPFDADPHFKTKKRQRPAKFIPVPPGEAPSLETSSSCQPAERPRKRERLYTYTNLDRRSLPSTSSQTPLSATVNPTLTDTKMSTGGPDQDLDPEPNPDPDPGPDPKPDLDPNPDRNPNPNPNPKLTSELMETFLPPTLPAVHKNEEDNPPIPKAYQQSPTRTISNGRKGELNVPNPKITTHPLTEATVPLSTVALSGPAAKSPIREAVHRRGRFRDDNQLTWWQELKALNKEHREDLHQLKEDHRKEIADLRRRHKEDTTTLHKTLDQLRDQNQLLTKRLLQFISIGRLDQESAKSMES